MSKIKQSPVKMNGKNGVIVHDILCADGPVDPVTGEPLIDPATGEPYPGKNDDMSNLIHDYLRVLRGNMNVKDDIYVPRYGVLSLLAMSTPIFIYDHPSFKKITNTAFTDGQNIFVDADFMRKLVEQEKATGGKKNGVIWVLLHELTHKLLMHTTRLKKFDPMIANIAEDLVINGKLATSFEKVEPVALLQEICVGMKKEDAAKYASMSEEMVAEMLWRAELKKKKKDKPKKSEDQQSGGGEGEDGEENENDDPSQDGKPSKKKGSKDKNGKGNGSGDPSDEQGEEEDPSNGGGGDKEEKEQPEDGDEEKNEGGGKKGQNKSKDKPSKDNGMSNGEGGDEEEDEKPQWSPIHHITQEELLDLLEENGLDSVTKALNLPQADDVEGIGKMKEKNKMNIVDAVHTAVAEAAQAEGLYPGNHLEDYAANLIGNLGKGKLSYKYIIRKYFQGDGSKLVYTDDEAGLPWYLDKKTMGVQPFYVGSSIPQQPDESVYVLIDSSGSTKGGTMRQEFLENALNVKRGLSSTGENARKVFIQSADTVLRGEPILITDANIEQYRKNGIPVYGDGGTSFAESLTQGLNQPIFKKENIKVVIYFTDCIDHVPQRKDFEEHINKGIKIVFICPPGLFNEQWNKELTWAEVYAMEEGTEVDLTKTEEQQTRNTRRNKMKV